MPIKDVVALLRWRARQQSAKAWGNHAEFDRYVYAAIALTEVADELEGTYERTV